MAVCLLIWLYNALLRTRNWFNCHFVVHLPARLRRILGSSGSSTSGIVPKPPTVLGVVIAQTMHGPQHEQAICRILKWASVKKFRNVLLYEPSGSLSDRADDIHRELHWGDPDCRISIMQGWQQCVGNEQPMQVTILSSRDSEWPLRQSLDNSSSSNPAEIPTLADRIGHAMSAPERLKGMMVRAAGPLAALEPDIVIVFGKALTLAGFPPWSVRVSELYRLGELGGVTWGTLDAVFTKHSKARQRFGR